jgi:catechol 2,3-dioxygenase-like lactoylglutathione lyase family enzyme
MASTDALPLGNFSVSLAAKDIAASRDFYEKLGFSVMGGGRHPAHPGGR